MSVSFYGHENYSFPYLTLDLTSIPNITPLTFPSRVRQVPCEKMGLHLWSATLQVATDAVEHPRAGAGGAAGGLSHARQHVCLPAVHELLRGTQLRQRGCGWLDAMGTM